MEQLFYGAGELVTADPQSIETTSNDGQANEMLSSFHRGVGLRRTGWFTVKNGKFCRVGSGSPPQDVQSRVDLEGRLVLPGLIDCHTHPLFAGDRSAEFVARSSGKSYADIANEGGGILATVSKTKNASAEELKELTKSRLSDFLRRGVTTVEVKSGYGLSTGEELRHLKLLNEIKKESSQTLYVTALILHAVAPPYTSPKKFATDEGLPLLESPEISELADSVDAFIETGYFDPEATEEFFLRAKELGLDIRLHADEFSDAGAAAFAAKLGAKSADHLQFASSDGLKKMAQKGVVATVLPGTSLYTGIPFTNARKMIDAGLTVAVATDFNPGSCAIDNLPMVASLAAVQCGLTGEEALLGVTLHAAKALGMENRKGSITPGKDADFVVHSLATAAEWIADFGKSPPEKVFISGKLARNSHKS